LNWDSSIDERDRAYMQNVHIRDSDIRADYAFPSKSANRESVWQDRGVAIPLRGTPEGGGAGKILTP
jgi:hypothetical protein